jgi:hypothetical protein
LLAHRVERIVVAADIAEGDEGWADVSFGSLLAGARGAVADLSAAADRLREVDDHDLSGVMGELTTLVGRLDGLRVAVTRQVRDRGAWRLQGVGSLTAWLRADPRTADVAWSLSQMATRADELPKTAGLLADGQASLAQAGTVCWQVSQLPTAPVRPEGDDEPAANTDPEPGDERWAGLWRSGDVHAAADELFARYLPRLDAVRLRVLGAHLREAADRQERAGEDHDDFARRALRISRSLGGNGEISGRLHPEAAELVIAAFEELGAKAGPDDKRTKPQRWADALTRLTGLAGPTPTAPLVHPTASLVHPTASPADPTVPPADPTVLPADPTVLPADPTVPPADPTTTLATDPATMPADRAGDPAADAAMGEPGDDQPSPDGGHGHDTAAGAGHHAAAGTGGIAPPGLRRPRVIVTVPLATLFGHPLSPGAVLGAGIPITGEAARRFACDAEVIRLITAQTLSPPGGPSPGTTLGHGPGTTAGTPAQTATGQLTDLLAGAIARLPRPLGGPSAVLDIGRKSQSWTPRQRDALYGQYGGRCGAPGCLRPIDVIHHIVHWLHGGQTRLTNGAPFCDFHHWLVHEGGWRVTRQPDGTLVLIPPPPGWRPGTIYRRGKPLPETTAGPVAA